MNVTVGSVKGILKDSSYPSHCENSISRSVFNYLDRIRKIVFFSSSHVVEKRTTKKVHFNPVLDVVLINPKICAGLIPKIESSEDICEKGQ